MGLKGDVNKGVTVINLEDFSSILGKIVLPNFAGGASGVSTNDLAFHKYTVQYNTNFVYSYSASPSNPLLVTNLVINHTQKGEHALDEEFVIRFGLKNADGTLPLISYGEGNSLFQAPRLESFWGPLNKLWWNQNHKEIINAVKRQ